jgi:protein SCO1
MTTKRLMLLLFAVIALTVGVARARRGGETEARTFQVSGVVVAPPADGHVMVAHDAIPDYMPGMTMPFAIGADSRALMVGDRVRFTLHVAVDRSRTEDIMVTGRDAVIASAATEGAPRARVRLKKGAALPNFSLTTQDGQAFTEANLQGRVTALTFIFTRCPVPEFCSLMVKRFQQVQREMERDRTLRNVQLVSVTLDPTFDTPAVLEAYAKAKGARADRWRFVTGDPAQVSHLTTAFAVHTERNGVFLDHTLATVVIGADGRIVEIWRGNGWNVSHVVDALRRTTQGASVR